jgi:glycerophosphoryl diester phosphodiesterase
MFTYERWSRTQSPSFRTASSLFRPRWVISQLFGEVFFLRQALAAPFMLSFDLQGHRGARGLKPENTLPSFEVAFDIGVSTIETDVHLTRDGIPVLIHDSLCNERICRPIQGGKDVLGYPVRAPISTLTLDQLRMVCAFGNPDPQRFFKQNAAVTPLARIYGDLVGMDPYAVPRVADLFAFAEIYAGEPGSRSGKSDAQRARARQVRFDLELKRVPFYPIVIGDGFDGESPALLEQRLLEAIHVAQMLNRTLVRSFDHRCVRILRQLEPGLTASVLIAETAPVSPGQLAQQADAQIYCPDYRFLDQHQVQRAHAEGIRVVPWTVNEPEDWQRLINWGVDGITTDYPDQLATLLRERAIPY